MAKPKFIEVLEELAEEKGIEKETFLEMLKESIEKAYKKNYMSVDSNCRVVISEKTGKIRLFEIKTVVDEVEDEDLEMSLSDAKEINKKAEIGMEIEKEVDVELIGRLAAIQTKQLFRQKIRETEKETLYNEYADKKDDIIVGIVDRIEPKFAIIKIGKTGAFLASKKQIPGEHIYEGQHLKVYVSDVERDTKGTHIVVSRIDPNFVRRLFELEVPEVYDGTVEIKSVSREAGERSKIAVYTQNENIDAIGACVGPKGTRVKNVVDELNGEMIDIIEWSADPVEFITHALSPSSVVSVTINESDRSALAIVPDNQLSLAIGKRGQNARLAVRLTGWKIDIKSVSEATELGLMNIVKSEEKLIDEEFEEEFVNEMLDSSNEEISSEEIVEPVIEAKEQEIETEVPQVDVVEEVEVLENTDEPKEVEEIVEVNDEVTDEIPEEKQEIVEEDFDSDYYNDFDDEDERSKYDEEIDYDEFDSYYDE